MRLPGKKLLRRMFGLDWRSLALLRISLALVLLIDLAISSQNLRVFFTDAGVLPRAWVYDDFHPDFSLHMLGDGVWFQGALFAIEAVFGLMMLVGYRTRLATIACWFLLLSRQGRQPLALYGADMVEHVFFFWAMWLPLNRRYSLDAALGRAPPPLEAEYFGMAGFAAIAQFIIIYVSSSLQKTGLTWTTDHTAVYYALALQVYCTRLGQWLNQFDFVTKVLTVVVVKVELYAPFLLILPVATGWGRLVGCLLLGALQLGFGLCMQLGLFGAAMGAFMLMLLPAEFWTWFAEPIGRWLKARGGRWGKFPWRAKLPRTREVKPVPFWQQRAAPIGRWMRDAAVLVAIIFVLILNLGSFPDHYNLITTAALRVSNDLGLTQSFDLFAPNPQTYDGWYVLRGWLKNGQDVDLVTGESPPDFDPPPLIADSYLDERWRSFLLDLTSDDFQDYREGLSEYLAREWNATHRGDSQVQKVEIIYMCYYNGPDHTVSPTTPMILWTQDF